MSTFERWSLRLAMTGVIINAALFIGLWVQIRLLAKQVALAAEATQLDHERRRKTETFGFANAILEQQWAFASLVPDTREKGAVERFLAGPGTKDGSPEVIATRYLDIYENLAAAVNVGVLDLDLVDRLEGGRIVHTWDAFEGWVCDRRERFKQDSLFVELQLLAERLRALPPAL